MGSLDNNNNSDNKGLAALPSVLFYEITKFLPVVDYQDDFGGFNPFLRLVKFKRGYALAVVSRQCHALFEETAKIYLLLHTPRDYFRPPLPRDESASCLSQFYTFKAAECKFRYEQQRMHEVLQQENPESTILLEEVQINLAVTHFVSTWEPQALLACLTACRRAMGCGRGFDYIDLEHVSVGNGEATAACPLLQQIATRYETLVQKQLDQDKRHEMKGQLFIILAVYHVALMQSEPQNQPAAVACLQKALDMYDTQEFVNEIHQELRLKMYHQLTRLHIEAERFDEGFALLQRARDDTRHLDPVNLYFWTGLVYVWEPEFGLERSIAFLQESNTQLEEMTPAELIWFDRVVHDELWTMYIRNCSEWLSELESRRQW